MAENESTFDLDPPRRPALSDLGSAAKEDDPKFPPNAVTMPTAAEFNHQTRHAAKVGSEMALARLVLSFSGGTPSVALMSCVRDDMDAADFGVTDNGAGDTTIEWTTGTGGNLPAVGGAPMVSLAADADCTPAAYYVTAPSGAGYQAVRCKTRVAGTLTDTKVVISLY